MPALPASDDDALTREDFESVLAVTRALAAPFDLLTLLSTVADAACRVLHAERASVWLLDGARGELVLEVARDAPQLRLPVGRGLVGACIAERRIINVPDCYADPRFEATVDRATGFVTRNSLSLPLVDHRDELIGALQVLNHRGGPFDLRDESRAGPRAAPSGGALSRVRLAEAQREAERLHHELELARSVQMSTLPAQLPEVPGYDMHGIFLPAEETGGDAYDLALVPQGLLLLLADAAGHGIAPALAVTRMHAMLRMALQLGADLETSFQQVNDLMADSLVDGRFVCSFVGLLDFADHRVRFLSGGQGPILHLHAADGRCERHRAQSFPLGAMRLPSRRTAGVIELAPGDLLALVTDGVFEQPDAEGRGFGVPAVERLLARHREQDAAGIAQAVLDEVRRHSAGAGQADDITLVVVKRCG